jgi:hypothetical protein
MATTAEITKPYHEDLKEQQLHIDLLQQKKKDTEKRRADKSRQDIYVHYDDILIGLINKVLAHSSVDQGLIDAEISRVIELANANETDEKQKTKMKKMITELGRMAVRNLKDYCDPVNGIVALQTIGKVRRHV